MPRKTEPVERREGGEETHPAFGLIGASRVQTGPTGAVLFDSEVRHQHSVIVRVRPASRRRDLNRDWIHGERMPLVEVEMSEAQWAAFVSSMNAGDGVPCTIRATEADYNVPDLPYEPRMQQSMDEVRGAADRAAEEVRARFAEYREKKTAANLRSLQAAIENMPANVAFAAASLAEHAENVVQKARADVEAMVLSRAQSLGLEPGDLGLDVPALGEGEDPDSPEARRRRGLEPIRPARREG